MKLLIVLSLIACGYAAKLDRTYLPPASAGSAGGSPGSLNAPLGSGPSGFGQPSGSSGFGQPSGPSGFGKATGSAGFGQVSGPSGFGQPSGSGQSPAPVYGAPGFGQSGAGFGKASSSAFGAQPSGQAGSQFGQSGSGPLDAGFSQPAQNFGGQGAQDYQRNQPQRSQASAEQNSEILRYDNQNDGDSFSYSFETSNGIAAEESGVATNGVQAVGSFSYSDDEGQTYRVAYTADENGYQPQGDHLPTPHPIPEEILKSIEINANAAAAGTQEGAYNPEEDNAPAAGYPYGAPTSNSQSPSGSGSFNPQGGSPSQLYGAPGAGASSSRPQSGASPSRSQPGVQGFQPQGPSQQYGAPAGAESPAGRPSGGFGQPQTKTPSQLYGASSPSGAGDVRPNSFGQSSQGPSQQYGAPGFGASRPSSGGFAPSSPSANSFAPSGPASQARPNQAPQATQFPSGGRPQGPQNGQAQDDSGYQYNRPQGALDGANGRPTNQGPAGQYRPQNGAAQPAGGQGSFPRPNSGYGAPSGPAQGSFGPSSGPSSQGSFGPSSGLKGPGAFGSPAGAGSQGSGPSQGSYGPSGSSSFGSPAGPSGSFGPSAGSKPQSFGPSSNANGFGRPQGSFPAPGAKGPMPDSGYQYNQPGSQGGQTGIPSQPGFKSPSSGPGAFGGPRQPPSFSEEEGYKY